MLLFGSTGYSEKSRKFNETLVAQIKKAQELDAAAARARATVEGGGQGNDSAHLLRVQRPRRKISADAQSKTMLMHLVRSVHSDFFF